MDIRIHGRARNTTARLAEILLALLGAAAILASSPDAVAARTSLDLTETTVSVSTPDRQWVDAGILHLRGRTDVLSVTGALHGTLTAVLDIDVQLTTSTGTFHGTVTFTSPARTWVGAAHGTLTDWAAQGSYVAVAEDHSTLDGTFNQTGPTTFTDHVQILTP